MLNYSILVLSESVSKALTLSDGHDTKESACFLLMMDTFSAV